MSQREDNLHALPGSPRPGDIIHRLGGFYRLDGDLFRCTSCRNGQHIFWCSETFQHRSHCKAAAAAPEHPWLEIRDQVNRSEAVRQAEDVVRSTSEVAP